MKNTNLVLMTAMAGSMLMLSACGGSVKAQAEEECAKQAEALPSQVDSGEFCSCLTGDITDSDSTSEAEKKIRANTQKCTNEAMKDMLGG